MFLEMSLTTDILINIFSYCDSSCLYPLLLTSKYINSFVINHVKSPNVIVMFNYNMNDEREIEYDIDIEHFAIVSWKEYIRYKRSDIRIYVGRNLEDEKNIYCDVTMKRIIDLELIKCIIKLSIVKLYLSVKCKHNLITRYKYDIDEAYNPILSLLDRVIYKYEVEKIRKGEKRPINVIDKNINSIPLNILDYVEKDCSAVKFLISEYNFKFSEKSILCALENKCEKNLGIYYSKDDKLFNEIISNINFDCFDVHYQNRLSKIMDRMEDRIKERKIIRRRKNKKMTINCSKILS